MIPLLVVAVDYWVSIQWFEVAWLLTVGPLWHTLIITMARYMLCLHAQRFVHIGLCLPNCFCIGVESNKSGVLLSNRLGLVLQRVHQGRSSKSHYGVGRWCPAAYINGKAPMVTAFGGIEAAAFVPSA